MKDFNIYDSEESSLVFLCILNITPQRNIHTATHNKHHPVRIICLLPKWETRLQPPKGDHNQTRRNDTRLQDKVRPMEGYKVNNIVSSSPKRRKNEHAATHNKHHPVSIICLWPKWETRLQPPKGDHNQTRRNDTRLQDKVRPTQEMRNTLIVWRCLLLVRYKYRTRRHPWDQLRGGSQQKVCQTFWGPSVLRGILIRVWSFPLNKWVTRYSA